MRDTTAPATTLLMTLTTAALAVALHLALSVPAAVAGTGPSAAEAECVLRLNKAAAQLSSAASKNLQSCMKDAAAGKLPAGQTADECLIADNKGRIAKAASNVEKAQSRYCPNMPAFGYTGSAASNAEVMAQHFALTDDILGTDLAAAAAAITGNKSAAKCQSKVLASYLKILKTKLKMFEKCKKSGFGKGTISSAADLEACVQVIALDARAKIGKAVVKLVDTISKSCGGVSLANTLPGGCAGIPDLAACIDRSVECRACLMLNGVDGLDVYCDEFDDTEANASCIDPRRCGNGIAEPGEDCDDGNNTDGDCCSATCTAEAAGGACSDDGNGCTNDLCDGNGACGHPGNTDPCDDGVFCNGDDTCSGGSCSAHTGDPCAGAEECAATCNETGEHCNTPAGTACTDDGNGCTSDVCNGSGGCAHPANTDPCDDGSFCNGDDTCSGGSCSVHTGDPCSGGAECGDTCNETDDDCNVDVGTTCTDDGNVCTDDRCDGGGSCVHPNNTAPCDDGVFCNGADTCSGGTCTVNAGDPCTGGAECANSCNETDDDCNVDVGTTCTDDGNVCSDDVCDGSGACSHPDNTAPCDDGSFCNGDDTCAGGSCSVNAGDPCSGGAECVDTCDEVDDDCDSPSGTTCTDDGNECTDDQCDGDGSCGHPNASAGTTCGSATNDDCTSADTCNGAGGCLANDTSAGTACTDDGNGCTDDQCDGGGSCTHPNNSVSCDDGTFCNGDDTCSGGSCSVHAGDPCPGADGDGNCSEECNETADACTGPDSDGVPCDDGVFCNGSDTCSGGSCSSHGGDPCTGADGDGNCSESCNETSDTCTAADPNGSTCNDGTYCNGTDTCSSGSCSSHSGNPCPGADNDNDCSESCSESLDLCVAADPNGSSCNDGAYCNGSDTCSGGSCSVHTGNPCPGANGNSDCSETCNEGSNNCTANDPNGSSCSDGQTCNGSDSCSNGSCVGSGVCCGTRNFTFNINSSSGGAFSAANWPGGGSTQQSAGGCTVSTGYPSGRIDTVGNLGDKFRVTGYAGFQNCYGTGEEDGDGCRTTSCPFAGIAFCEATRPSCSVALNGSGSARYSVQCVDP